MEEEEENSGLIVTSLYQFYQCCVLLVNPKHSEKINEIEINK